jgi:hypothetical protein
VKVAVTGAREKVEVRQFVATWSDGIERGNHTEEEKRYVRSSWRRYAFVLERVEACATSIGGAPGGADLSILDVGPHFFTTLLRKRLPNATINTLGYENPLCPPSVRQDHVPFNLADSQFPERWPAFQKHDIVVMGEVIEHLYTAPWLVLRFIREFMKKGGYLVLSTPNAVDVLRRLNMFRGRNPYEMLREELDNPGHIREYTATELVEIGKRAGLGVEKVFLANYFLAHSAAGNFIYRMSGIVPQLRNGITVVYRA